MMRRMMPIVVGAVLGALVVTVLLRNDSVDDRPAATTATATAQGTVLAGNDAARADESGPADTVTTLGQLSGISNAGARREAALALLDVYGNDAAGIETVSTALPPTEVVNFRIDAIVKLGARDTHGAFAAAMALPEREQRRLTLLRLAPALAESDPLGAIAAVDEIDARDLESDFIAALLDAWAVRDPMRVFGYLESADKARVPVADFAFAALAASDPQRLLALADELPTAVATGVTTAALQSLIEEDPVAAITRIDSLSPGNQRSRLENSAARVYGERDPEAAWEWAHRARASVGDRMEVLAGVVAVDPDRAWGMVLSELTGADTQLRSEMRRYLSNYLYSVIETDSPDAVVAALDRIMGLNDPGIESGLQFTISAWADRAPEAALEWSLRNADRIDSDRVLSSLSAGLARTDIDLARQTIYRLRDEHRLPWVTGVGRTLAQGDLGAARAWAFEFPRGRLRDAALHELISAEAYGSSVDMQLFDQFSDDTARDEAARSAALPIACNGLTDLALEIAATHIADSGLRVQTVRQIEGLSTVGSVARSLNCQLNL